MSIVEKIGPDTISRLEKAAERRYQEALYLEEGGHRLTSIYLAGYVAEMTIGAAYFGIVWGLGANRRIDDNSLKKFLTAARSSSKVEDKSHPLDGLARVLIADNKAVNLSSFGPKIERTLISQVDAICEHWCPKLRYRAIEATSAQSRVVLEAARWIIDHCPKH